MTRYRCLVVSTEGQETWRVVEATSEQGAMHRLTTEGLTPLEVRTGAVSLAERLNRPVRLRPRHGINEQALILTQLAMLIRSGLPVDRSLDLLRDQSPRATQRDVLGQALNAVRSGHGLAQAFERQAFLPAYAMGVIRSAERSGKLGDALASLASRMTAVAATRRQLATALTYPAAVLAATILALILVLTLVVPQFQPVFAGEEAQLPALTRIVLILSDLVMERGAWLLAALGAMVTSFIFFLRSDMGGKLFNRIRHRIPGLALRDQYLASQFTGVFGTLIGNGISVVDALPLAREAMPGDRWKRHIAGVEQRVREGVTLSHALSRGNLVPTTAIRLIEVGERSGRLADTCQKASEIMGDAARARIERIVALANPVAIVSLGGLVAMLVAGVMLGIFALGDFAG